ncbi:MAG: aquaporin [Balneolaceae bacterium]
MRNYVAEVAGTFFFVLVFGFTGNAIAIGLVLTALVYIGRHVSGAHFNPAVSLGFYLQKKLTTSQFAGYISSQLLGAFLASILIFFFSTLVFYLEPPTDTNLYQQAGAEILFTFLFVLLTLTMALSPAFKNTNIYGFAIGLAFGGIILAGSSISGGIYNPATSIGSALFDLMNGGDSYQHVLLYTFAPLTGGALAAATFSYLNREN